VVSRFRPATALAFLFLSISTLGACGDGESPGAPGSGSGGGSTPGAGGLRLAWSQDAPSLAAVQAYTFILFIDGARTGLTGASCASAAQTTTAFDCSGPLPPLMPGRHVLEMSVVDPRVGVESPKSAPLALNIGADGRPSMLANDVSGSTLRLPAPLQAVPATVCAAGAPSVCYSVSAIADDLEPIRRLVPLPDGRLLMLQDDGTLVFLPSRTRERLQFGGDGSQDLVTDVALDPDFASTGFVFLAIRSVAPDTRRTVSVVRVRELANGLGEAATLVPDLPAASTGAPVLSVAGDRRIYLAMPGRPETPWAYDGHLLRFTLDGRPDGTGAASPVLAQGPPEPARLAFDSRSRLLLASAGSRTFPTLSILPLDTPTGEWRPKAISGLAFTRLADIDISPGVSATAATLAMIDGEPGTLSVAALTVGRFPQLGPKQPLALTPFTPTAIAFAPDGDLIAAASRDRLSASVLRLRPLVSHSRTEVGP
jgi:hypothetical protein